MSKKKGPGGRPTDYSLKLGTEIADAIASSTFGLEQICRDNPHFPAPTTIYSWTVKHPEFSKLYNTGKEKQADNLAHHCLDIADDIERNSIYEDADGIERVDPGAIARDKLRIETRKWAAARLRPHKWSEKIEIKVDDSGSIERSAKLKARIKKNARSS